MTQVEWASRATAGVEARAQFKYLSPDDIAVEDAPQEDAKNGAPDVGQDPTNAQMQLDMSVVDQAFEEGVFDDEFNDAGSSWNFEGLRNSNKPESNDSVLGKRKEAENNAFDDSLPSKMMKSNEFDTGMFQDTAGPFGNQECGFGDFGVGNGQEAGNDYDFDFGEAY